MNNELPKDKRNLAGPKLRELRKKNGYSAEVLSDLLLKQNFYLSARQIRFIENGDRRITDFELLAFLDFFDITFKDIFGDI